MTESEGEAIRRAQPVILGWDLAGSGGDQTIYCVREGIAIRYIGDDAAAAEAIARQLRRKHYRVIQGGLQST